MAYDTSPAVIFRNVYGELRDVKTLALTATDVDDIIADIRIETTLSGASTMEIDVIDPGWVLLTSGFLDVDAEGRLRPLDVNYPGKSNFWWRLTQVSPTTDQGGVNLTLTFEDRVVSYLRKKTGAKSWSRASFTRAQAIKAMVDEVKAPPRPVFISPELKDKQIITAA